MIIIKTTTTNNCNNSFQIFLSQSLYEMLKYESPKISKTLVGATNITSPYKVWIINVAKNLNSTVVPVKTIVGVYKVPINVEKLLKKKLAIIVVIERMNELNVSVKFIR